MNAVLVYSKNDYQRNSWFADEIIKNAAIKGINMDLLIVDGETCFSVSGDKYSILSKNNKDINPDFAIVRTISPQITYHLETAGIRCFNNYATSFMCNDKFLTISKISRLNIPTIPTTLSLTDNLEYCLNNAFEMYNTDELIVKSVSGHGGKEVFLTHNTQRELEELLTGCNKLKGHRAFCIQPRIKGFARDLRVYVLGKKIYAARLRTNPTGFKSNFTLGGTCEEYLLNESQISMVRHIIDILDADFIGIDFIMDEKGSLIFNEIEDVVGTRMLYATGCDQVVEDYLDYIIATVKG